MSSVLNYSGWLSLKDDDEASDILFISSDDRPLAEILADDFSRKNVTVRYWASHCECKKEDASTEFIKQMLGKANGKFNHAYSEITGYLWTDEEMIIGGHDLIAELKNFGGTKKRPRCAACDLCIFTFNRIREAARRLVLGDRR